MIEIGCCLPGGSFMPQGVAEVGRTPGKQLRDGCAYLKECGYDYAEAASGLLMKLSEEELRGAAADGSIRIRAVNSILPPPYALMPGAGEVTAMLELEAYLREVFRRCAMLGGRYAVFGSGKARSIPAGVDASEAEAYMERFLRMCDGLAEESGLELVIEPLNRHETNLILTLADGLRWARRMQALGCRHICLLADTFHMSEEGLPQEETFAVLEEAGALLKHCHAAEPVCRKYPSSQGGAYVRAFMERLREIGYCGGVTVECGFDDFCAESRLAADFLKNCAR